MRLIPGGRLMRQMEEYSINECGIPTLVLQERAALAVRDAIFNYAKPESKVLICCGVGNNGADGLAVSRLLKQSGFEPFVCVIGNLSKQTDEFKTQANILKKMGIAIYSMDDIGPLILKHSFDVVVDALFGIGLSRDLSGDFAVLIDKLNGLNALKIAVDIPSGIDSETGEILGTALKCDVTVTFSHEKIGTALYPGAVYAGKVIICDVGHLKCEPKGRRAFTYDIGDLEKLPRRPAFSHKGNFGRVLVIAGSAGMSGAAYLASKACYRCGAGLIYILTPKTNRPILQSLLPEAVVYSYDSKNAKDEYFSRILNDVSPASIVMGPGMGRDEYVQRILKVVLKNAGCPVVLDADGLNALADIQMRLDGSVVPDCSNIIATPHVGEMANLLNSSVDEIKKSLPDAAIKLSRKIGAVSVLKDARTVVSDGTDKFYINMTGNNGMATGGSGDVLSGVIGAFCAAGMSRMDAAVLGVFVHGLAGDMAEKRLGARSMLAGDLIESLSEVLRQK